MELKGKTIIITGASSGIGAAAALLFAREGAQLVLGARREAELRQVAGLGSGCIDLMPLVYLILFLTRHITAEILVVFQGDVTQIRGKIR